MTTIFTVKRNFSIKRARAGENLNSRCNKSRCASINFRTKSVKMFINSNNDHPNILYGIKSKPKCTSLPLGIFQEFPNREKKLNGKIIVMPTYKLLMN